MSPLLDRVASDGSQRLAGFADLVASVTVVGLVIAVVEIFERDQPGRMEWALLAMVASTAVAILLAYFSMHVAAWFTAGPLDLPMLLVSVGIVAAQGLMILVIVRAADLEKKVDQLATLRHWLGAAMLFAFIASIANSRTRAARREEADPMWQDATTLGLLEAFRDRQEEDIKMSRLASGGLAVLWLASFRFQHEAFVLSSTIAGALTMLGALWNQQQTSTEAREHLGASGSPETEAEPAHAESVEGEA